MMRKTIPSFLTKMVGVFMLVCLLAGPRPCFSQDVRFDHLTGKQGLSQNNVWDIYQDRFGFIWIATEDGLNLYDGYSFTVFTHNPDDPSSISNSYVGCIAEDKKGNLWVGTQDGLNFYDRERKTFSNFKSDETEHSLFSNDIAHLFFDSKGNLWIGTSKGLNHYDLATNTIKRISDVNNTRSFGLNGIRSILEDHQHRIWVATSGGLRLLNANHDGFTDFHHVPGNLHSLSSDNLTSLFEDRDGVLWVGTVEGGLNKMVSFGSFTHYVNDPGNPASLPNNYVFDINEDADGNLWVATDESLNKMDKASGRFVSYADESGNENSLKGTTVTRILFDATDRMWVGTRFGGINIYDRHKYVFQHHKHTLKPNSLSHNNVTSFEEDKNGNFWIGTDGGGINYFDRQSGKFSVISANLPSSKVLALERDGEKGLWIGTWQNGLSFLDFKTNRVKVYLHDPKNGRTLSDNNVFYILKDSKNRIWIATWGNGLNLYDPVSDSFTRFTHDPGNPNSICASPIQMLMEDSKGKIWIATSQEGVDVYDPDSNIFSHYKASVQQGSLSNNGAFSLFQDSQQRIWVGTNGGGLNLFQPETNTFKVYRKFDGLPNDGIMCIQEDAQHKLWLSTNKGLSCFDPERLLFKNFTEHDGLQGEQFNRWASFRLSTGELLFGGTNGFNLFNPESIKESPFRSPVYITDFKIDNKSVGIGKGHVLSKNILFTDTIVLDHTQNEFSFEFTGLGYSNAERNKYMYRLGGFQSKWIEAGTERKASYTNLSPGVYTFEVKASNNNGVWNQSPRGLTIIIEPPFWGTLWFKLLAVGAITFIVLGFIQLRINAVERQKFLLKQLVRKQTTELREQKEALEDQAENMLTLNRQLQDQTNFLRRINDELQQQREEAEKARHIAERATQAKSIFLATMSHEIRTPMNGVLGMAALLAETSLNSEQREYTNTIRSSGDALLTVINDILDFSKIESGNLEIDNHSFSLRSCIEEVMDLFATKAAEKNLDLLYQIDHHIPAQIIADSHRIKQVLINLLGNAMKFTDRGEVFLGVHLKELRGENLQLQFLVKDTGIGISEEKRGRLFKAFSQVDSSTTRKYGGTGLGLVISQRLIELMGGNISVDSTIGEGTTFLFSIASQVSQQDIKQYVSCHSPAYEDKTVLLVDDNRTNLVILKSQFELWRFTPVLAYSANEALNILSSRKIDLVVTDMQMPETDGVQLSQQIKAIYPSLPIILLSSVGEESKRKYPDLFASVLTKPVKQHQLLKEVQLVLRGEAMPVKDMEAKQLLSKEFAKKYPLRMLLVEDNPVNQKLALGILRKLGYETVDVAYNGLEAVAKLQTDVYEVVLMDIQMPEMDGLEATKIIRSQHAHQPVIIAMTANAMREDKDACLSAGMNDYISKPINLEQLVNTIERAAQTIGRRAA
jgi:signal transduction histidine kinase/ligand-binding sensor domain-containing protein/DNA-binding response OmpR family regulator